jgi:hypothetical protein
MLNIIARLALKSLDRVVLDYIKEHPGQRLFQIDRNTLNSHHNWGTKHVVQRLEDQGRIVVQRQRLGEAIAPRYYAA